MPNGTLLLHRLDLSHRAFSYCSCKKYTKVRYWGDLRETIWSNGKGHFVPTDQNDQTGQSGHAPLNSGRTKPKWSIPLDVPIEISEILGLMESAHWITGNAFRISLHAIGTIGDGFLNFSIMARSQILVNTLRPRTLFPHCFANGLNQKVISVCGARCSVVRCQVLRIQWNFKFLERKKVSVISKSVVLKNGRKKRRTRLARNLLPPV